MRRSVDLRAEVCGVLHKLTGSRTADAAPALRAIEAALRSDAPPDAALAYPCLLLLTLRAKLEMLVLKHVEQLARYALLTKTLAQCARSHPAKALLFKSAANARCDDAAFKAVAAQVESIEAQYAASTRVVRRADLTSEQLGALLAKLGAGDRAKGAAFAHALADFAVAKKGGLAAVAAALADMPILGALALVDDVMLGRLGPVSRDALLRTAVPILRDAIPAAAAAKAAADLKASPEAMSVLCALVPQARRQAPFAGVMPAF